MKPKESGIKIEKLYLEGLSFRQSTTYDGSKLPPVKIDFDYNTEFPSSETLIATLAIKVNAGENGDIFSLDVKMAAIFKQVEAGEINLAEFAKHNAAAHLYPFARETVASIISRTTYPTLLLPPVNLIKTLDEA